MKKFKPKALKWKSRRTPLSTPGWEYTECETAKAWGKSWDEWKLIPIEDRALMVAHEIEAAKRQAYMTECLAGEEAKPDGRENSYNDQKARWGLKAS